jgi:quinol monooxygenase YgiN
MSERITVAILFEAKPRHFEDLREALRRFAVHVVAEDGCVYYKLYQVIGQNNALYVHEQWTSQASFETHRATTSSIELNERFGDWLSRPLSYHMLDVLSEA